ncbi:hypothetical protein BDC45DRAFT_553468 [Circinella umbellata]|nr:hypothetical protein BDC45DRAFT_553468 [Circinella umbellata]
MSVLLSKPFLVDMKKIKNIPKDDALKLLETLTFIIVLEAYDLKNARFKTFTKLKIISIQVIKRKDEIEDELRQENVDSEISEEKTIQAVFQSTDHLHHFSNGISFDDQ